MCLYRRTRSREEKSRLAAEGRDATFPSMMRAHHRREFRESASETIVMPRAGRWRACNAWDRTEIFVNGPQVMVRQVSKTRPRHCLEKVSIEWSGNAARVNNRTGRSCCTGRMEVIQVHARRNDLNKLPKRAASCGQAGFIGCQVAGDDDRRTWHRCTKTSAATQVRRRIDYRRLAKVWIIPWQELIEGRAGAMALIAGDGCIDDIAA